LVGKNKKTLARQAYAGTAGGRKQSPPRPPQERGRRDRENNPISSPIFPSPPAPLPSLASDRRGEIR